MSFQHEAVVGRSDVQKLDPRQIRIADGWNPRMTFGGPEDLALKESIKANGVLEPVRVRKGADGDLYLINGERRLRATMDAIEEGSDIRSIPAIVERSTITDAEAMYTALACNTGRPLTDRENAEAFRRLTGWGQNINDIARRVGRGVNWVKQRLALVDATPEMMIAIELGELPVHCAASIIKKAKGDPKVQSEAMHKAKEAKIRRKEYIDKTPAVVRDLVTVADMLTDIMEDGGVPEDLAAECEEPLRRVAKAAEWLLKPGNRGGQ
jgi:ParB/RepB/Spo0J family partition protein